MPGLSWAGRGAGLELEERGAVLHGDWLHAGANPTRRRFLRLRLADGLFIRLVR
jgi:hypothetical protein